MKYAHYDETNGKLLGWYDSEIHTTIPTPSIEVGDSDWQTAIDNNYNFVDVTTKTLSLKDFRTFDELQEDKINEIRRAYEKANQEDITYMGATFQADKDSQNLIVSVLSAGSVPDGFGWLDSLNNLVAMAYTDLQGLSAALLARGQLNFAKYQDLKAQVNDATTRADLDAIMW